MKTQRLTFYILFLFMFGAMQSNAQVSYHTELGHYYEDTAITGIMTMTFDNSGNTFYSASAHYIYEDQFTYINEKAIKIWKRSTTGVISGSHIFYKYHTSSSGEYVAKMIYTGSALYVLVQGVFDSPPNDRDVILLKYNSSMVLQWSRLYDGVGSPDDYAVDLAAGPAGSILILVKSLNNMVVRRYSAAGAVLNTGVYDSGVGNDDDPKEFIYNNNAIYVSGTRPAATGRQTVLVKYNNTLVQQWALLTKVSSGATSDQVTDMCIDTSGNVYVAGSHFNTAYRPFAYKVNPTGVRLWTRRVTANNATPLRIFTDNNAQPFMYVDGTPDRYIKINKTTGAIASNIIMFNNANQHFDVSSVDKGTANDIYVIGDYDTTYFNNNCNCMWEEYGYRIAKINNSANIVWTNEYASPDFHFSYGPYDVFARGNSRVYYNIDESWVGFAGTAESEDYAHIHCVSPFTGAREEEIAYEAASNDLNVYPNPANDIVHFTYNTTADENATLELYDINGQIVLSRNISLTEGQNDLQQEVADYRNGIYILRIITSRETQEQKILINR